jgi:hypothetical protein
MLKNSGVRVLLLPPCYKVLTETRKTKIEGKFAAWFICIKPIHDVYFGI